MIIYKVCDRELWESARQTGVFRGAPVDLADGFIHFSGADQIAETVRRHFAGAGELVIVAVDAGRLGEALRFEASRGGALFPHLYAPLTMDAVLAAEPLPIDVVGGRRFPRSAAFAGIVP